MSSLRPTSVCDTTPLQRFESQSSSSEEPSSPTAASIIAAAAACVAVNSTAQHPQNPQLPQQQLYNNNNINNNVKVDLQLPPFVGVTAGGANGGPLVTKPTARGTAHIFGRIVVDLSLLSCVGLTMLGFSLWGEPNKRGFFCDDLSLKHPYKESTIRSWMLYLLCAALPVSLILLVEFYRSQDKHSQKQHSHHYHSQQQEGSGYYLCHMELPHWLLECYRKIGCFVFGLGIEQLTTDIAKYAIGRLRPHFLTLCQPVLLDGTTCSDASNAGRYIEDFTCSTLNVSAKMLKDMRLSFPSGHASFACYSMIYLVIYLQRRMHWPRLRMFRHLLQFLLLMFAWYTALSRVSDYKHHWSDVLAGSAIGFTYAVVVTSTIW